jgi:hypothetical protein
VSDTVQAANVCIVGAGPRGLSVLERLCANARTLAPGTAIAVHLIDPYPPGPGRVWRTDQPDRLLMNTVASQVTAFTDPSVEMDGPVLPGPSLYDWAGYLAVIGPPPGCDPAAVDEARRLRPDDYPTRAFYGHYLAWAFRRIRDTTPDGVHVVTHRASAVSLHDPGDGRQRVTLTDGTVIDADAVVLAQGHVPAEPGPDERALAEHAGRHALAYLPPQNPSDADLSGIRRGQPVFLRGLGLSFFDHMSLLTEGRGGRFVTSGGRLRYLRSGDEPRLYAGSRRGVPHQSRGENQKGPFGRHTPLLLTPELVAELRARPGLGFRRTLWPLIAKEVETVYYATLLTGPDCSCDARRFRDRYLPLPWGDPGEAAELDAAGIAPDRRWDWDRLLRPYAGRVFADRDDWRGWLLSYLDDDLREARAGNVGSARKAALDVLRDLRNEIRLVVDHGGLDGDSYRDELQAWYSPMNAYLSIGPPASRVAELVALIEAGVLELVGPDARITPSPDGFLVSSPLVPGPPIAVTTVVEARLQEPSLARTADPLLRGLLADGRAAHYRIGRWVSDGLAVSPRPYHLLDAAGRPHPRCFAFGVPTEAVHWVTAVGIRPGLNSVTVADADAIARAVLTVSAQVLETVS